MNDDFYLQQAQDASEVVVTPHSLERGYDADNIEQAVRRLDGTLYLDTEDRAYHLVTEDRVILFKVQDGKRVVITAYPRDEPAKYQSIQYRLLQG